MFEIIEGTSKNLHFNNFKEICLNWWDEDKKKFELNSSLKSAKIIHFLKMEKVIGGFLLTSEIVNSLKEKENQEFVKTLAKNNYLNLTYFIIDENNRGRGIGTKLLSEFLKSNKNKLWLTANLKVKNFYEKLGFECNYNKINNDNYILTYDSD